MTARLRDDPVNTAGRMLSWGLGWTAGATLGGLAGAQLGIRPAMVLMGVAGLVAAVVAWTSPLRPIAAGREPVPQPSAG